MSREIHLTETMADEFYTHCPLLRAITLLTLLIFMIPAGAALAEYEWTREYGVNAGGKVLDLAYMNEDNGVAVLTQGELAVYRGRNGEASTRLKVDPKFDSVTVSPTGEFFILASSRDGSVETFRLQQIFDLDLAGRPRTGPEKAPAQLIIFSDYQCPSCARTVELVDQLLEKYAGKLAVIYKNYPLKIHPAAEQAARVALAADMQGKFHEMHHLLYKNGNRLTDQLVLELARDVVPDYGKLLADVQSETIEKMLQEDKADADETGISGVPSFFVNSKPLNDRSVEGLTSMIESEISRK